MSKLNGHGRHGQTAATSTHGRTESVIWQVDFQAKVMVEQGLGELLDDGWVCKIELTIRLEAVDVSQSAPRVEAEKCA